jgi:formamidopyrimidine-DNA glycosylase
MVRVQLLTRAGVYLGRNIPCRPDAEIDARSAALYNKAMPELPEVETIARGVHRRVRGDRIVQAWFGKRPQTFKTPASRQAKGLAGRTILAVHRTGKHIVFELGSEALSTRATAQRADAKANQATAPIAQSDAQWIVHLGMTGRLLIATPDSPVAPHTHARLDLASGNELRFVDPRRFGRLEFRDLSNRGGSRIDTAFEAPGAEPLAIGERAFAELFGQRRMPIKAALLNQSLLAGVGNIYADESLFQAGIRPRRRTNRLTAAELEKLRLALRQILAHAIRLGGSSVSDYVDAEGARGFFQLEHCVYQRTGEPCRLCQTPIRRIELAGRGTHYCPICQR